MEEQTKIINQTIQDTVIGNKKIRTINPPIHNGSTILFESYTDLMLANKGEYSGLTYGTDRMVAQRAFEEALCDLEKGYICRAFQSGISAISHALLACTKAGDHILICDNVYWPTSNFCNKILTKFGIEISYAPADVGKNIGDYLRDNTVLIFMESPGSNSFEIQDIEPIVETAQDRNIITMMDASWATPLYHKPLELGIDVSIQSVTKYIAGHSDILMGAVTVNNKYGDLFADYYKTCEIYTSPSDCYTSLKGLKTLKVRMTQHEQSALGIAQWLEKHPLVDKVIHPALSSHPQHNRWKKYFRGASGLFGFTLKEEPDSESLARFMDNLQLFGIGYSWGGFKSLITAGKYHRSNGSDYDNKTIIRLNIGLEDCSDLQQDIEKAFYQLN